MTQISLREAQDILPELVSRVEAGESITVTRNGKPVMELVAPKTITATPSAKKGGINWEALEAFKKERGITEIIGYVSADFDDPLPEDFLITPLPPFKNGG